MRNTEMQKQQHRSAVLFPELNWSHTAIHRSEGWNRVKSIPAYRKEKGEKHTCIQERKMGT